MLFDTLCRIAEHSRSEKISAHNINGNKTTNIFNNPYFHTILKDTKIFDFPALKLRDKLKTIDEMNEDIDIEFANEYKIASQNNLPFKHCYFHFHFDPGDDYVDMGILLITTSMLHILEFYMIYGNDESLSGYCGRMDNRNPDKYRFEVMSEFIYRKDYNRIIIDDPDKIEKHPRDNSDIQLQKIHGYFSTAMALIHHPKQFIFEENPVKEFKGKKIKRSHQRPKYTILDPYAIRKILKVHNETGRIVSGHDRCGYWRRYHNDRFVNMKGKRRWIDAIWVGPHEKTIGNKKYKVRLDL